MKLIYNDAAVDLPAASDPDLPAFIRIWAVPEQYMPSGFFVDCRAPGQLPQVPACAGRDSVLLAELTLHGGEVELQQLIEGARIE